MSRSAGGYSMPVLWHIVVQEQKHVFLYIERVTTKNVQQFKLPEKNAFSLLLKELTEMA